MIIRAWRITKAKYTAAAFSGGAAKAYGGRWNTTGTSVIYTAGSNSLAILEMLVHLQADDLLQRYVIVEVSFDEMFIKTVDPVTLPKRWRRSPAPAVAQQIGDDWVASGRSAVLRLPSVIVPTEWNCLINPAHADFAKVTIGRKQPITFDPRLVKTSTP